MAVTPNGKFDKAYTFVKGNKPGERIGIVAYNETGYYATNIDDVNQTEEQVEEAVAYLNKRLDIPEDVAESMRYASLFGWDAPIADRAHWFFKQEVPGRKI